MRDNQGMCHINRIPKTAASMSQDAVWELHGHVKTRRPCHEALPPGRDPIWSTLQDNGCSNAPGTSTKLVI